MTKNPYTFLGLLVGIVLSLNSVAKEAEVQELPMELFAANSQYRDIRVSPDGKHIAFTFQDGNNNEVKLAITSADLKQVKSVYGFGDDFHVGGHYWANNDRVIMDVWKNTGYLDGRKQFPQRFITSVDGKNRREIKGNIRILSRYRKDPKRIIIGSYDPRDKGSVKIHKLNLITAKHNYFGGLPKPKVGSVIVDANVDTNDVIRVALEYDQGRKEYDDQDDRWQIHYKTPAGDWRKVKLEMARQPANYVDLGFNLDSSLFYFLSNYDQASSDTMGLFSLDLESGEVKLVFRHPDVDITSAVHGPNGEVLAVNYEPGYPQRYYLDNDHPQVKLLKSLAATFPDQWVSITSVTDDGRTKVVKTRSERNPGTYYYYRDGKLKYLADERPDLPAASLGRTEPFIMHARDGKKLYGFITLPPGREAKNLPMLVYPHGGPYGPYDRWGYDPGIQAFANRGYAVLQVNFRGSGGYGVDFMESGYGKWGLEMQDDITDATWWAIKEGIADRDRICITGGSYGGYATLQALVKEPDLYKCGVGVVGVYSLPVFRKKGDYRRNREASEIFLDRYVGSDENHLKSVSPVYNADKIKGAVFLIHGSEDVRVPIIHAELMAKALDAVGKPYEWLVKPEGHGFVRPENRLEQYQRMLAFFDKHIGKKER